MPYTPADLSAGDRIRYRTAGLQVRAEGGKVVGVTVAGGEGTVVGHGGGRLHGAGWRLTRPDVYVPEGEVDPVQPPEGAACLLHPLNFEAL